MAKLFASETAAGVCDQAARVFASYGYAWNIRPNVSCATSASR